MSDKNEYRRLTGPEVGQGCFLPLLIINAELAKLLNRDIVSFHIFLFHISTPNILYIETELPPCPLSKKIYVASHTISTFKGGAEDIERKATGTGKAPLLNLPAWSIFPFLVLYSGL